MHDPDGPAFFALVTMARPMILCCSGRSEGRTRVPVESNTSLSSCALDCVGGLEMNSEPWNSNPDGPLMMVWSTCGHPADTPPQTQLSQVLPLARAGRGWIEGVGGSWRMMDKLCAHRLSGVGGKTGPLSAAGRRGRAERRDQDAAPVGGGGRRLRKAVGGPRSRRGRGCSSRRRCTFRRRTRRRWRAGCRRLPPSPTRLRAATDTSCRRAQVCAYFS